LCHRGDFDEIEPPFLRHLESTCCGHDPQLGSFFIHDPNLWDPDHLIHTQVSTDGSPLLLGLPFRPARAYENPAKAEAEV
jgi:hypothetical protein